MAGQLRPIIEVPCDVDDIPTLDILRQLDEEHVRALGVDPQDLEEPAESASDAEEVAPEASDDEGDIAESSEISLCDAAAKRIDRAVESCLAAYEAHGVYKVFNPVICTLPPAYTEPAIKLIGTMMMFHGQSVYERLRRATHCALMAVALSPRRDEAGNEAPEPEAHDDLDQAILDATRRAFVEVAADHVNSAIIAAALEEDLYTDNRLSPGDGDFPVDSRSQITFYTQSEKRIGLKLDEEGELTPRWSTLGVVGMYDPSQKGRKRGCGRCRYRKYCSIRAIGMRCYGGKGSFKKPADDTNN